MDDEEEFEEGEITEGVQVLEGDVDDEEEDEAGDEEEEEDEEDEEETGLAALQNDNLEVCIYFFYGCMIYIYMCVCVCVCVCVVCVSL